jgi:ribosomal protein S18 acetylase RimI-like enzyme
MFDIRTATSADDIVQVRRLSLDFVDWLRVLFADDPSLIDEYFAALQPELAHLPGRYAPPGGCLLLARVDGRPVGTVGMRDLGDGSCEMKRLFVDAAMHGQGIGLALVQTLLAKARQHGYLRMRLDTSQRQVAAVGLYRRLGFREIGPYYAASELRRACMYFMELPLAATAPEGDAGPA